MEVTSQRHGEQWLDGKTKQTIRRIEIPKRAIKRQTEVKINRNWDPWI